MVAPDNKINPITRETVHGTDEKKRRPPVGDFDKISKELEEHQGDDSALDFQLSKKKMGKANSEKSQEEQHFLTPFDLARGSKEPKDEDPEKKGDSVAAVQEAPEKPKTTPFSHTEEPKKSRPYETVELPDLAAAAPLYKPSPFEMVNTMQAPARTPQASRIQEVIDLIVDKAYSLKQGNDTQTVIELKGSFRGSTLIVKESESAPGQINITIDNLTAENQMILEANRQLLTNELMKQGVHVQIFLPSATLETPRTNQTAENGSNKRDAEDQPQQDKQKKDEK